MRLLLTQIFISVMAHATPAAVNDLVLINQNVPSYIYIGFYKVAEGEALDYDKFLKSYWRRTSNRYSDLREVYRLTDIITYRGGQKLAVLRRANLWRTENFGFLLTGTRSRLRNLSLKALRENSRQLLSGEDGDVDSEISLVPLEYVAPQIDKLNDQVAGDLVIDSHPLSGSKSTGVVRAVFEDGRALIYPLKAFSELRPELSTQVRENAIHGHAFGPELVGIENVEGLQGPLSSYPADFESAYMLVDLTWRESFADLLHRTCNRLLH